MNRELKFRVWPAATSNSDVNGLIYKFAYIDLNFLCSNDCTELIKPGYKWMQYTGLKDKNEKEIYEGDIIEAKNNSRIVLYDIIEFSHGIFHGNLGSVNQFLITYPHLTIIGNIYENPELLNEKAN